MPATNSSESILTEALAQNRNSVLPNCSASDCNTSVILDCVVNATQEVFRLNCDLDMIEPVVSSGCAVDRLELSSVVSISGARNIAVAVNATEDFCKQAYMAMIGDQNTTVEELHDTLNELTNQLVGSAKEMLPMEGLQLGLPTIVWGPGHSIAFAADMTQQLVRFANASGLRIEVGIGSN